MDIRAFAVKKFGWMVLVSHIAGIIFITKYDALCQRPFTLGIFAWFGIGYCVMMIFWSVYHLLFMDDM